MKKILFAIDSLSGGGAERVVTIIANQAFRFGNNVGIVLTYGTTIKYEVESGITIYDIYGNVLPHLNDKKNDSHKMVTSEMKEFKQSEKKVPFVKIREGIAEYKDFVRRRNLLAKFINEKEFDVVISFLTNTNMLVGAVSKYVDSKLIISERSDPNKTVFNLKSHKKILKLYQNVDAVVFQTVDALKSYPECIQKKGTTISNPIKGDLPERFVGQRRKEIVSFARLESQKNLQLLIYAFLEVYKKHPEYTLRIYGSGSQKRELEALIELLQLKDVAHIEAFRKDIHNVVRDAMMYVSTSNYEGISNSMLEALAIGLPTICTDCPIGGARQTIKDGVNGFLVPVNDKKSIVDAMSKLIDNPELGEQISSQAVSLREELSAEKITKKWLEISEVTFN